MGSKSHEGHPRRRVEIVRTHIPKPLGGENMGGMRRSEVKYREQELLFLGGKEENLRSVIHPVVTHVGPGKEG